MNNLNSVLIEGVLLRDPELAYTANGTPVANFDLAAVRFYKDSDSEEYRKEVSHFTIEVWGRQAEICVEHFLKDWGVRVIGRLKQSNDPHPMVYIVAEQVEFNPKSKRQPA